MLASLSEKSPVIDLSCLSWKQRWGRGHVLSLQKEYRDPRLTVNGDLILRRIPVSSALTWE